MYNICIHVYAMFAGLPPRGSSLWARKAIGHAPPHLESSQFKNNCFAEM